MSNLSPEERYLWACGRNWRNPAPPANPEQLDWERVIALALANRMQTLLDQILTQTNLWPYVSEAAKDSLHAGVAKYEKKATELGAVVKQYMPLAAQQQLPTLPLKGLWVSCKLYDNPAMRPGHDLDVLVKRSDINRCIALLETLQFGRYWPDLMPDNFYRRHHLHLELSLPDCWTWVEVHWAFDHPRTLLTIDYDAVVARAWPDSLLGVPIQSPNPVDLLLYLSVHLVKHAVYLPFVLDHPQLERIILAEKRLMYFLDVAEAIKGYEEAIDWDLLLTVAHDYGAVAILGSVLHVCATYLEAPVPAWVQQRLVLPPPRRAEAWLMAGLVAYLLDQYAGKPGRPFWRFLMEPNWLFVFRPIRLFDFLTYLLPTPDYLRRRYGRATAVSAITHTVRALGEYVRLVLDTVFYSWQRKKRPLSTFSTQPSPPLAPGVDSGD